MFWQAKRFNPTALTIGLLMLLASVGAMLAKPRITVVASGQTISLENLVPAQFGDWHEDPGGVVQVVNPQTQALLDKIYSQILNRNYIHKSGYRIMLSIAYGTDQRGSLSVHKPEVCYPAQGFTVKENRPAAITTEFGEIPARRILTELGPRREPVTYWFTVGDRAIQSKLEKRLETLRLGLTGQIPDGLLFRVSSIDADPARAFRMQEDFVKQLLSEVPPPSRKRLAGL